MKRIITTLFCIFSMFFSLMAQTNLPEITFLETPPEVDGVLDNNLSNLPVREFVKVDKSDKTNPDIKATYRLAYTRDYLYVYVEAETDKLCMRDLGYQNGDGITLLLANPKPNQVASEEFYVLGFSPQQQSDKLWQKQVLVYKNDDLVVAALRKSHFEAKIANGKVGYELLLSWEEVHPCHPWFVKSMGINLCFIKGIGDKQVNEYYMKFDKNILAEQPKHEYATIGFQAPKLQNGFQWFAMLSQNNALKLDTVSLQIAGVAAKNDTDDVSVYIHYGEGERASARMISLALGAELSRQQFPIRIQELQAAGYLVKWFGNKYPQHGENGLTILPQTDLVRIASQVEKLRSKLADGSISTLKFHLKSLAETKSQLKRYETAAFFRLNYTFFIELLDAAIKGRDVIAEKQGQQRRAFVSAIDSTLQPYSIKIPYGFKTTKNYPMLVFLHNNGEDDKNVLKSGNRSNGSFIEVAPFGRGTDNCFAKDSAQTDIMEVIGDVKKNYPVDSSNIILAGYAMGAYGALHTFAQNPKLYKAIALFSGNPDLANKTFGKGYTDFADAKNLKIFKNIPVFIYHDKNNTSYAYASILEFVEKLKTAGAKVDFYSDDNVQGDLNQFINSKYMEWLNKFSAK
ncbi:MAG: alpha/beta hydrolase-fold protein [Bacteroidota bacterium]